MDEEKERIAQETATFRNSLIRNTAKYGRFLDEKDHELTITTYEDARRTHLLFRIIISPGKAIVCEAENKVRTVEWKNRDVLERMLLSLLQYGDFVDAKKILFT